MNSKGGACLSFLCGALVGGAIALLYAPQSGVKTRRQIRDFVEDEVDQAKDFVNRTSDRVRGGVERGVESVREGVAYAREMLEDDIAEAREILENEMAHDARKKSKA